jgi:hypothetical protein
MLSLYLRLLNRLPKGFWSGLGVGTLVFVLSAIIFGFSYFFVMRPLVWPAIYGKPYVNIPGPFPVQSGEWLFVQLIWILSAIVFGLTASYLSEQRRGLVFVCLALIWCALILFSLALEPLPEAHAWRIVLQHINVPLGFSLGYLIWRTRTAPQTLRKG